MQIKQLVFQTAKRTKLPPLEIELILAFVLKKSREFLFAHPEYELNKFQISDFRFKISKRLKGIPIAYITGYKEFYGLDFMVNQGVLIPRPETELMVDEAINIIKKADSRQQTAVIIDIGTGSGNIIISLVKLIKGKKSDFFFLATDISKRALSVARKNARLHQVNDKIKFFYGNLLEPILKFKILNPKSKIIILANLPYLAPKQIKQSPTIKYEPKSALNGGADGLKYYRQLFEQIKMLGVTCYVLCEIDPSQTQKMKTLIKNELPTATYEIKKDLCGHNRLAIIHMSFPRPLALAKASGESKKNY